MAQSRGAELRAAVHRVGRVATAGVLADATHASAYSSCERLDRRLGRKGRPRIRRTDGLCVDGYTAGMTQRVGAKGQVVIPKQMRDELGLQPGAEVEFERDGETVRILPAGVAATHGLRGRYAASGMAAALLADRRREPR
jgi:AbrB family looped-hinge helix DNA binding protein